MLTNVVAITGTAFDTIIESNNASTKPSTFVGSIVVKSISPYLFVYCMVYLRFVS